MPVLFIFPAAPRTGRKIWNKYCFMTTTRVGMSIYPRYMGGSMASGQKEKKAE